MRLGYLVHRAELDAIVCSGPRRGKQFTYALLDERVSPAKMLERDEATAELVRRFFTSHGPAMVQDFVWWSGLTTADAKAGLEMAKSHLAHEVIAGKSYWRAAMMPAVKDISPPALLLPPYDEYVIAYRDHSAILDPVYAQQARNAIFGGVIVFNGQVAGNWKRTISKGTAVIEAAPFRPFTAAESEAFTAAAHRYAEFLGMPVVLA
jgi:hypothetical protein